MARRICVRPCPQTFPTPSVTVPFMGGAIKATGNFDLKLACGNCELASRLLLQLNPLLGSLGTPICLLGCVASLVNVVIALQDALGPPPDPSAIASAVADALVKCKCVVEIALPPPAGPICGFLKLVRDLIQLVVDILTCIINLMNHLVRLNLEAAVLLADPNPALTHAGNCLGALVAAQKESLYRKMDTITAIFTMISPVVGMLAVVPGFNTIFADVTTALNTFTSGTSSSDDLATMVTTITALRDALNTTLTVSGGINDLASLCP